MRNVILFLTYCFCLIGSSCHSALAAEAKVALVVGYGQLFSFYDPVSSVFIGSNEIAEVQAINEKYLYVSGLKEGRTNLLVMNYENDVIGAYVIDVRQPEHVSQDILKNLSPNGSLSIDQNGNTAILQGNARNPAERMAVLEARRHLESEGRLVIDNTTSSEPLQVALKVRIVELFKQDLLSLGFDITAIGNGSVFRVVTGTGIAEEFVAGAIGTSQGRTRGGGSFEAGQVDINAMLDLLQNKDVVNIVAEPMLTTTTGQKATFRSGGELALSVNQGDGVFTTEYKDTGLTVDFLPEILPNNRISIEVSSEIAYVDPQSSIEGSAPSLLVRSVDTKVDVASGQTFAIGGLYELLESQESSGLPGASRIPFLGNLFARTNKTRDERELVFFITPYLVKNSSVVELRDRPNLMDTLGFIVE